MKKETGQAPSCSESRYSERESVSHSGERLSSSYSGCQTQLLALLEEVLAVRVILVFYSHVEGLAEDGYDIGAVCGGHEVEGALEILHELVLALGGSLIDIYFVRYHYEGHVRSVMLHLLVPSLKVLVGDLATGIKDEDGGMSPKVVGGVQLIEGLLTRRVPDVYSFEFKFRFLEIGHLKRG